MSRLSSLRTGLRGTHLSSPENLNENWLQTTVLTHRVLTLDKDYLFGHIEINNAMLCLI